MDDVLNCGGQSHWTSPRNRTFEEKKKKKKERKKERKSPVTTVTNFVFRGPVGLTSCETSIKSSSNLGFRLNLRFLEIGLLTTDNIHIGVLAAVLVLAFTEEQIQVHIHIHENNNNNKSILAK